VRSRELWRQAYEGEVLGEALFSALADRTEEPERRRQLEVLALLERSHQGARAAGRRPP
jgi:hypothetical protein